MVLLVKNYYGTLSCRFGGLSVWFCDNPSNECYARFEKRLKSLYGDGFLLDYVCIDTDSLDVKVYKQFSEDEGFALPHLTVAWHLFFRHFPNCDLLKFCNIFARKSLQFINGRFSYRANRNYLRLHN